MFIVLCSSFCSTVPCLFESILMPKLLMQECYKMLVPVSYQIMSICHFCHDYCVLHMGMSSTCVLMYAMPSLYRCMLCIFLIYVVTSTSMQTRLRDVSDFRDLVKSVTAVILLLCIHVATERSMLISEMFSKDVL